MKINISKGDLFGLDKEKYIYAHCISLDCAMGKGIAAQFNKSIPNMKPYLRRIVKENNLHCPCVIPYFSEGYMIYNLVTKEKYFGKPTYDTIESTIREMAFMCQKNNTRYLAMPFIGCGLDRLEWDRVLELITYYFELLDIEIEVRYI